MVSRSAGWRRGTWTGVSVAAAQNTTRTRCSRSTHAVHVHAVSRRFPSRVFCILHSLLVMFLPDRATTPRPHPPSSKSAATATAFDVPSNFGRAVPAVLCSRATSQSQLQQARSCLAVVLGAARWAHGKQGPARYGKLLSGAPGGTSHSAPRTPAPPPAAAYAQASSHVAASQNSCSSCEKDAARGAVPTRRLIVTPSRTGRTARPPVVVAVHRNA